MNKSYLYHHGILGQHWGKKNGPPYPLGAGDHSASEKKAGWRRSLEKSEVDKKEKKSYNKEEKEKKKFTLSDNQKKAIVIGAAAVATGLAVYGAYKTGALDKIKVAVGEKELQKRLAKAGSISTDDYSLKDAINDAKVEEIINKQKPSNKTYGKTIDVFGNEFLSVNKHNIEKFGLNSTYSSQNCLNCSMAIEAKFRGKNVSASPAIDKHSGLVWNNGRKISDMLRPFNVDESNILNMKVNNWDGVNKHLVSEFGENSRGIIALRWNEKHGGGGHFVNWIVRNGQVFVLDGQLGISYPLTKLQGKTLASVNQKIIRTDNLNLSDDFLKEFVE